MKRIPLTQLRETLLVIQANEATTMERLKESRNPYLIRTRAEAFARFALIEAIEQALEGDTALLRIYLPEENK